MRGIIRLIPTALALLLAAPLWAQISASLTGDVTTDGKPLPGVTVTIASPSLQGTRTTVTGENGGYRFSSLPPGDYTVTFTLEGMSAIKKNVRLQLSQTSRTDAAMKLASVAEAITVTASAPSVLETPQVATTFTSKQIETLPVDRTPLAAALLAPGVTANTFSGNQFIISGGPGYDNLVMVNGVVVTENVRSQVQNLYIEDAVQETTMLTAAVSAEYGRFTGGVVNTITKSGGNVFSGSFRDSLSNPNWTSLTPFAGQAKPIDKTNNIYEETLGGFILRDRLWFFGAGREAKTSDQQSTVGLTSTNPARTRSAVNYTHADSQNRYEGKITGQISPKHNLVAAYLKIRETEGNNVFPPVYDTASLVNRELPNALYSAHYNGIITNNLLLEGQYSRRTFAFVNSGSIYTDLVKGTLLLDRSNNNTRFNSPTFCGVCAPETRDNGEYLLKGNYYLNTRTLGNHNFVAGYDNFKEKRFAENHQSGSDYRIFVTTAFFDPSGNIFPQFSAPSTFIRWTPIFVKGTQDKQLTQSAFVNDRWDLNAHWSFNVGLRYDRNDAADANGDVASKDSELSPRLTAIYDIKGNGRQRVTASYNQYVSRIIGANVGDQNQSSGNPGAIDYSYGGPTINPASDPTKTSMPDALTQVWAWFASQCGGMVNGTIDASKCPSSLLFPGGARSIPGFVAVYNGRLKSPSVDEYSVGYGTQIGATGYAKIDFIARNWKNFYSDQVTTTTPKTNTPLNIPVDLAVVTNSNAVKRTYRGVQFQSAWHPRRWNLGLNYTWSKLRGNDEGETGPNGPVVNTPLGLYYPEYEGYAQRLPVGYLLADQRHRLRTWAGYDFGFGRMGTLNTTLLESYDSGRPYATVFSAALRTYPGAPNIKAYVGGAPSNANYYVCRDCNRFAAASSTDLALNYAIPVSRAQVFLRAVVTNLFNLHALSGTGPGATVQNPGISTTVNAAGNQSANFVPFNPFTQTPVACPQSTPAAQCKALGANYQLASNFGQATSFFGYQQARTYGFSLGARF